MSFKINMESAMKRITNRKEIIDQIPLLATGKINYVPVLSKKTIVGEIYCNRVEYGEYEVGFTRKNISEQEYADVNWDLIDSLIIRMCNLMSKNYYKPFAQEPKEVRDFWFSRPKI